LCPYCRIKEERERRIKKNGVFKERGGESFSLRKETANNVPMLVKVVMVVITFFTSEAWFHAEPLFVNVYGAQESIPWKRFRQSM
jgi:hypothetical protein